MRHVSAKKPLHGRNSIAEDVKAGNIAEAVHLADTMALGMLAANPSVHIRLHLQTFYKPGKSP